MKFRTKSALPFLEARAYADRISGCMSRMSLQTQWISFRTKSMNSLSRQSDFHCRFDERFADYGRNKIQMFYELSFRSFSFVVLPFPFYIIHGPSAARRLVVSHTPCTQKITRTANGESISLTNQRRQRTNLLTCGLHSSTSANLSTNWPPGQRILFWRMRIFSVV